MSKSITEFIIKLGFTRRETIKATLINPSENLLFCSDCNQEFQNGHLIGCEIDIIEQFLFKNESEIQEYVRRIGA